MLRLFLYSLSDLIFNSRIEECKTGGYRIIVFFYFIQKVLSLRFILLKFCEFRIIPEPFQDCMQILLVCFQSEILVEASYNLLELIHLFNHDIADLLHILHRHYRLLIQFLVVIIQCKSLHLDC